MIPWSTPRRITPGRSHQAHDERGRADLGEAPKGPQVHERQGRGDDDRGQSGLGQVGQEPIEEEEQDDDKAGADQSRHLGLGPGLVGHSCAGSADGDGEALEEPGRDVRGPDADHLLVGVDLVAPPGGEARRRCDGVGQRHHRDAHCAEQQGTDVGQLGPRQGRNGNALGERADGLDAVGSEVEDGGDNRHADDGHQDGGHPPGDTRKDQQDRQDAEAGHQRRPIGLVESVEEGAHLADEVVGTGGESEELG